MNDFLLDPLTHDLDTRSLGMKIVSGAEAVIQNIRIKLKLWTGEWFMDTEAGTPYLEDILGKRISLAGALAAIRASIMEVDGVQTITKFDYQFDRKIRKLDFEFEVSTPYGNLELLKVRKLTSDERAAITSSSNFTLYEDYLNTLTNIIIPSHGY